MTSSVGDRRGSALLVTLLLTVAIVLVGTAFLMTTGTEERIASNESHAARARYAAEAGARAVKLWFERPGEAPGFPGNPDAVLRARAAIDPADPYGAAPVRDGPQYKEDADLDGDGLDDLFRSPYRGALVDTLLGVEDEPDMRIEDAATLASLSRALFGAEADTTVGVRVRVRRIDVYAPPYLRTDEGWARRGVGTIKVVAGVERVAGVVELRAERTVRMVLNEVDYTPSHMEALHVCGDAEIVGPSGVRWGALVATGRVEMPDGPAVPPSLPRAPPRPGAPDPLWSDDSQWVGELNTRIDPTRPVADPWVRIVAGEQIEGAPSGGAQPWAGPGPPPPGTAGPWECCDRSNLIQHQQTLRCPQYDYAFWKSVARSGFRGAHFYSWHPADGFRRNGTGPGSSVKDILDDAQGEPALRFFDTTDGRAPRDDDGDGASDNLTPAIVLSGAVTARGVLFVNTERLELVGASDAMQVVYRAPGEPYVGTPDAWIDLVYPDTPGAPFFPAGGGTWDRRGPEVAGHAAFHGLLVTGGIFVARGPGTVYGSVVARGTLLDGSVEPFALVRDASLNESWPPAGWGLPRFVIGRFSVE